MRKLFYIVAVIVMVFSFPKGVRAGEHPGAGGHGHEDDFTSLGNKVVCPVSKTCPNFYITHDTPKVDYQGKTYFFHCKPCVSKFKANPGRYTEKTAPEKGTMRKWAPERGT